MDLYRKLLILLLIPVSAMAQTGSINVDENHNGHKIFGLPTPIAGNEAATKAYADSVGGGGGGSVSLTATSPIIVTPSPITGTGVVSLDSTSKTNWDTAFTQTRQWNGGATGLVAGTGRTSLGLVIGTDVQAWDGDLDALAALSGTNTIYYRSGAATWSPVTIGGNMTFSGGTLNSTAGGSGTVTTTGSPATGNLTKFSGATSITNGDLTGDVTTSGTLATTIGANKVTLGDLATMATDSILGRATASTGNVEVLTALPFAFTGDVTRPVDSNAQTIANSAVTYAKMQNVSANSVLLGSSASGSGAPPSEIALGTNLSMSGSTLNATGGGGSVSITATSPIVVTPTPLTGTGVISLNNAVDLALTAVQTVSFSDAATATIADLLTLTHNSSGAAAAQFGTGLLFQGKSDTTNNRIIGNVAAMWKTSTDASRSGVVRIRAADQTGLDSAGVYIFKGNGVSAGTFTDPGGSTISASGFKIAATSVASGFILQSDGNNFVTSTAKFPTTAGTTGQIFQTNGTNFVLSTPQWPTASGSSGVIVQSNGTNLITSTPTWPTAAGTAGYTVRSDGTNFASYPAQLINSSTASQSPSTSDVYLTGSNIVVAAGDMKAKGQYKCVFDMTKSAGTGAIVITLRVGTAGSTSDPAIQTYTFGAGTSVADLGIFEVIATWRTVGSGTSAVMQGMCRGTHQLATTGLFNNAGGWVVLGSPSPSSGFASNTATNIGISFNGSTAFAGTTTLVQAQLQQ